MQAEQLESSSNSSSCVCPNAMRCVDMSHGDVPVHDHVMCDAPYVRGNRCELHMETFGTSSDSGVHIRGTAEQTRTKSDVLCDNSDMYASVEARAHLAQQAGSRPGEFFFFRVEKIVSLKF